MTVTDDLRIDKIQALIAPAILMEDLPANEDQKAFVAASRETSEAIMAGTDPRLLVVVGPCSIHDSALALEYAERLKPLIKRYKSELQLVMRVYFEKPRTTVGWKGYINDPHLDNSFDINRGLRLARTLLLKLTAMGMPAGTEFLDTISPQYVADLVTWGAIGARTTESQVHRELASGLSMPVGFKNGTDGNIKIAIDAIGAARGAHAFLSVTKQGVSAIVRTLGNPSCHVILRGSSKGTNFDADSIRDVTGQLEKAGLPTGLMVDCSHGNSLKDHKKQPAVAEAIAAQISAGDQAIRGIMIESHLIEGAQSVVPGQDLVHGQSITDKCISWETTEEVLATLAEASARRTQMS
ncbi:MAG: 3-deoxy-7-phosphoheptulonate synthase [Verrucomicrobiales bacterium]|jgi:3-deoxy-7-phosphoheptulonate synthase